MFYKKNRGFTPLEIPKLLKSYAKFLTGFTLIEMLIVIIIIGILAALALPQFGKTKEHALGKEAISNLKLIAAAEKIYRMEANAYYPIPAGSESNITNINNYLKLSATEANWDYSITSTGTPPSAFTATGDRTTGSYPDCIYRIDNTTDDPTPVVPADCP